MASLQQTNTPYKFVECTKQNLDTFPITEGCIYFTDTGEIYIDEGGKRKPYGISEEEKAQIKQNKNDILLKLNKPRQDGINGQLLRKTTDGTEWTDVGQPTNIQVDSSVNKWLDAHPEATTTVQDGSLTDTKLENNFNKKLARFYNSVAEMKADTTLKDGMCAVTLGYYEPNDGGGSDYIIRIKKPDESEDGGSIIFINHNLVARLVVKNDTINIKQFGCKEDIDNSNNLINAINFLTKKNGGELFIPKGNFKTSKALIINEKILIKGINPSISILSCNNSFNEPIFIDFKKPELGGGIRDCSVFGINTGIGINVGTEKTDVKDAFILENLNVKYFYDSIIYKSGWQIKINNIYAQAKHYSMIIEGADTNISNINLSAGGLKINTGTIKLTNCKIDNVTSAKNEYPCYLSSTRGSIVNLEVQFCKPNGLLVQGEYLQAKNIIVDSIGKTVDEKIDDSGYGIVLGYLNYSNMDITYRHYGNTVPLGCYNKPENKIETSFSWFEGMVNNSNVTIYSDKETILTNNIRNKNKYELPQNLDYLVNMGILTKPTNFGENKPYIYTKQFTLNLKNFALETNCKQMFIIVDYNSTGSTWDSIYDNVGDYSTDTAKTITKNKIIRLSTLKGTSNSFKYTVNNDNGITLNSLKILLYDKIGKISNIGLY